MPAERDGEVTLDSSRMTENEFGRALGEIIFRSIDDAVASLRAEIEELKAQALPDGLRAIAPNWQGVYTVGLAYGAGSVVVHASALWIAKDATAAKPGAAESGWTLVVKSPR